VSHSIGITAFVDRCGRSYRLRPLSAFSLPAIQLCCSRVLTLRTKLPPSNTEVGSFQMLVSAGDGRAVQKTNTVLLVGQARVMQGTGAAKDNGNEVQVNAPLPAEDGLAIPKINFVPLVRQGRDLLVIVVAKDVGGRVQINAGLRRLLRRPLHRLLRRHLHRLLRRALHRSLL